MSRSLSAAAKAGMFAQQTGAVYLVLLKIEQDDLPAPIRVVNNPAADVVSNGETYLACWFDISLPSDQAENVPQATITIDNVNRSIMEAVRTMAGTATVTVSVVLASDPDTVEVGPYEMALRNVSWNVQTVSGVLSYEDVLNEPYPGEFITPDNFAGMF